MGAKATHSATLYGADASTAFANAATTKLTANTKYQVSLAANQRVDPAVNVVVEVDADGAGAGGYVVAAASSYTFDYLSGIVTFTADQGADALVRVSGAAMNVVSLGAVKDVSLSLMAELVEETTLADTYKKRKMTLQDFSADLSGYTPGTEDLDSGAATLKLTEVLANGGRLFLEVAPLGLPAFRAWVKLEGIDHNLSSGGLVEANFKAVGAAILANDGATYAAFGYAQ